MQRCFKLDRLIYNQTCTYFANQLVSYPKLSVSYQQKCDNHHRAGQLLASPISCRLLNNPFGRNNFNIKVGSPLLFKRASTDAAISEDTTVIDSKRAITQLERAFARFEDKCQRVERVNEKDFVRTFDLFTKTHESLHQAKLLDQDAKVGLTLLAGTLLRCCGKLMGDTDVKTRELLAGNLWHFLKEKRIPMDISHYNSLLRVLNENSTNYDPEKILEEISQANLNPDRITYQRLIHQYCVQGDITKATSLLEKMKELNMELNEIIFASLIVGYSKQETPPNMSEMFDLMRSNGIEPSSRSYAAAMIAQIQLMPKNLEKAEKELNELLTSVEKEELMFPIHESIEILATPNLDQQNPTVERIVDYISKTPYNFNARYRLYNSLLKIGQYEKVSKLYWLQDNPQTSARRNTNAGNYYVRMLATHKSIPIEHVIKECTKLVETGLNPKAFYSLYYSAAESGNLPVVRAALKKISEDEPIKCHYLWPLIAQAKNEEELIQTLKNDIHSKLDSYDLMDTFAGWVWPKFADNPNKLFELNRETLNFDNNLLMASFLNYSVQENRIEDAIKFVSEVTLDSSETSETAESQYDGNDTMIASGQRGVLMGRLLSQIAEFTKDPSIVNKTFNLCKLPGQAISGNSLTALIRVHILNEDYKTAMEEFFKIAQEYRATPCKTDLIMHCLEKKDSENLQKIMDISNEIYGETNSLFDLALCCLKSGKLKQAQKIFNSPNFRVNPSRVYRAARGNVGNINMLENLVQLTRDMYDVNQETLYQILIDAYERSSNAKRVLDLWNKMQEEEFQPSKRSLFMIANVLERNGIEVPFQKPNMDIKDMNSRLERRNVY